MSTVVVDEDSNVSSVVDESDPMRHLNDLEEMSEGHAAERRTLMN